MLIYVENGQPGMLATASGVSMPLITLHPEGLLVRSPACGGKESYHARLAKSCKTCLLCVRSTEIRNQIISWAYKIEEVDYAHEMAYGSEAEALRLHSTLVNRNYLKLGVKHAADLLENAKLLTEQTVANLCEAVALKNPAVSTHFCI